MARWRRALTSRPAAIAAGVFVLYLLTGYFLVGPVLQWALPKIAQDKLDSRVTVAQVQFDPLRLALIVKDFHLAEPDGAPLVAWGQLYVRLEWSSALRFAWHLRDFDVDGLRLRLALAKDGRFNWDGLLAALKSGKKTSSNTIPRILVDHVRLSGGTIDYVDDALARPYATRINPVNLELNDLSTLPSDTGGYTLSARLPGQEASLRWAGHIGLNPLFSQGDVALTHLDLARTARALNLPTSWKVGHGVLSVSAHYRLRAPSGKLELNVSGLQLGLQQLAMILGNDVQLDLAKGSIKGGSYDSHAAAAGWKYLDLRGVQLARSGQPMLGVDAVQMAGMNAGLANHHASLESFNLAGGQVTATIDHAGRLDWESTFPLAPESSPGKPGTAVKASSPWTISIKSVDLSGIGAKFADQRFRQPLLVEAQGVHLAAAVRGVLGGPGADWNVTNLAAGVGPMRVLSGSQAVGSVDAVELSGGQANLAQRDFLADALVIKSPATQLVREKSGKLNWQNFLVQLPVQNDTLTHKKEISRATESPLHFSLARMEVQGANVTFEDLTPAKPVRMDLKDGQLVLSHLSQDLRRAVPLSLALHLGNSGKLMATGEIVPARLDAVAQVRLTALPLVPFAPYVNQYARLTLKSGEAYTAGRLEYAAHGKPLLSYRGGFSVNNLAIAEEGTGEPFLGWSSLRGSALNVALAPDRISLRELVAERPFGKIIINPDKSINLKNVLRTQTVEKKPPTKLARVAMARQAPAFPISVRQILIHGGDLQFADLSLQPQFGARIEDMNGAITGLSNRPDASAQVELDGRVGQYGSAQVRGKLQPFEATDNTDLTLRFRNLEMNPLSPYSGKFAGRLIDSGRLSVDLQYKIKHRELAGQNRFVISKLKLGPSVSSPDAVKLPLDLAIALLENSEGIIDVDIPISGNLDDPKFSYGHLIWQAILNLLTKVVTAPFRALGALLGVDSESFGAIDFSYGEAALTPPQLDKLHKLAAAMAKRPNLKLAVDPTYDAARDTAALREQTLRQEVAKRLRLNVPKGARPPPIDVHDRVTRLVLEELYDKEFPGGISALRAEIKPADIGVLYEEAVRRLEQRIAIPQSSLEVLARARAQAVVTQMGKTAGAPPGRVVLGQGYAVVESQAPELAIKLELKPASVVPAPTPAAVPAPSSGQPAAP